MRNSSSITLRTLFVLLGLLVSCSPLATAGFAYDETADGDLPHPNSAFIIPFGSPNPNTIRFKMDLDSDGWILQVDPGETLRSFTMTMFVPSVPPNPAYGATFHMYDGSSQDDPVLGIPFASFGVELRDVDFMAHFGIPPLGEGRYLFNFWHDNAEYPTMEFDMNIAGQSPVEPTAWGVIKSLYR